MPKRRTEDVVHVVMTDHLIQRRPPARDLLAQLEERHPKEQEEYRGEIVPYYPATLPKTGADALYRAFAQLAMGNNLRAGISELSRLLAIQQPREPEWDIQLGEARLANGEPLAAIAAYQSALRLRPQMPRALQGLAKAFRAAGQLPESLQALQQAVAVAPSDGGSWYQLGVVESDLGRNRDAADHLRRAVALDPNLPGVYATLARVQFAAGQLDDAAAALGEALRIDPYESAAWDLAGRVRTTKGDFRDAFYSFERAIRYRPDFAPHLYDYALALSTANDFDRAEEQVRRAIRFDAGMFEAHTLLGGLLARKRQFADAAMEYAEAVRLRPQLARTRLDLASVLAAQGKMPEAIKQLQTVAKSGDAEAAKLAADALLRLGQR
jgi:tetratricopeptide (TPR) repeat protein